MAFCCLLRIIIWTSDRVRHMLTAISKKVAIENVDISQWVRAVVIHTFCFARSGAKNCTVYLFWVDSNRSGSAWDDTLFSQSAHMPDLTIIHTLNHRVTSSREQLKRSHCARSKFSRFYRRSCFCLALQDLHGNMKFFSSQHTGPLYCVQRAKGKCAYVWRRRRDAWR